MTARTANTKPSPARARILVFTGEGKGKTTAAMGMALRAAGHGLPTRILQFLKADERTGELTALRTFPQVQIQQVGKGFVPSPASPRFACHRTAALAGFRLAAEAIQANNFALVVLDELCTAISLGLLPEDLVITMLREAPANSIIALTGRGATPGLIALADTVTNMQAIKHGMATGHKAQAGVEF